MIHGVNFPTDFTCLQDPWLNNNSSASGEPLFSNTCYPSTTSPPHTHSNWVDSQIFLPIFNADTCFTDNTSPDDRVPLHDMHNTPEISSSAGPDRTTQDDRRSTRFQKKPYTRPQVIRKKVAQDQAIDESKILAPPSPRIDVSSALLEKYPTKLECRSGLASSDGRWIRVNQSGGLKHVPFGKGPPVAAKPGDRYRCRWEGCRFSVFATLNHMRAHMRHTHKISGNMDVKCQWHPPIRVLIPGHDEPVLTSNHESCYACNTDLHSSSLLNHIDSHLNFERQANPNVIECSNCGDGKVRRGNHRCKGSRGRKEQRDRE